MSLIRRLLDAFAFALISWALAATAGAQIITTVAGGALPPTALAGVAASIPSPQGVATDAAGNVYLSSGNVVFKLDTTGTLTRVAGTSIGGYSGDNGPATSAQLNAPFGLAVDPSGNLYIADRYNNRVRKVSAAGIITTVAGNGAFCDPGLGLGCYSGDGVPATNTQLATPSGVAVDASGNLYIADTNNNRIRKVSVSGTITTVAGNGSPDYSGDNGPATSAKVSYPYGVAVDGRGNLYIADTSNTVVRQVSASGIITTVAGGGSSFPGDGGLATGAQLGLPVGVVLDASGNIYIVDRYAYRVRKVSAAGIITTVAGNGSLGYSGDGGPATSAQLSYPSGVVLDASGNLCIADTNNNRVRKVSAAGLITTVAGNGSQGYSGDGGPATIAQLSSPFGVAVDASGNLYVGDWGNSRVRKVSAAGIITTVAGNGSSGYSGDGGPATSAQLSVAAGVAVDASGNLYIADRYNSRVRKVSAAGIITTVAGNGSGGYSGDGGLATNAQLNYLNGVAVDASGNLYIADTFNSRIRKVSASGIITTVAGTTEGNSGDGGLATSAQLNYPQGVAVDASGSNVYIADTVNARVRKVASSGIITTVAGLTGIPLNYPDGVAVDAVGNLYIADTGSHVVRKVSTSAVITILAGNFSAGYSGDGGPASSAQLNGPSGVAVDAGGNLYISDGGNNRVRLIAPQGGEAVLSLTLAHSGNFKAGQNGATYTVTVSNAPSAGATSGAVTVTETVPTGLTLVSMTGSGWNCGGNTCTRNDPLSGGSSYPAITVTVNVASGAASQVTNQVSVSGGGTAAATSDLTLISYLLTSTTFPPGSGAVTANPSSADGYYTAGTRVCLTATPNSGGSFSSWSGDALDGSGCLTMDSNKSMTANFTGVATFTVTTVQAGLAISVDGATLTAPQVFNWTPGSQHSIGVTSPQGSSGTRYIFGNWSDGGAQTHNITTPPTTTTFTANFTTGYLLTTQASPTAGGSITASPASTDGYYASGASVQLTANANPGYQFTGWSGDLQGATSPQSVTMSAPRSVTASFNAVAEITVAVATAPFGLSIVVDGATLATPQNFTWTPGSQHSIGVTSPQGTGAARYVFTSWSDGGAQTHTVTTPSTTTTFTANFAAQYLLTLQASPAAGGSATASPSSADGYYTSGTAVQLTPVAANCEYQFTNWSGDLGGIANPASLTMGAPHTVTANFYQYRTFSDNGFFVCQQYLDLLGRAPDTSGYNYWVGLLNSGQVTRGQVADAYFVSPEFQGNGMSIISAYIAVLGRNPDFAGWLYWLNNLWAGTTQQQVIDSFIQSTEFQQTYGTLNNTAFVTLVYQNVLGRAPDAGGLSYWVGLLNSGAVTRGQCMDSFATSAEFQTQIQNQALATLLYMGFLRRSPDPAGVTYWTGQLSAGVSPAAVLSAFITSAEYMARF